MTLFWTLSGILVVIALAFVLLPLFRYRRPTSTSDTAIAQPADDVQRARVDVYRTQIAELQGDLDVGTISQEQFDTARLDLQRNLLEATDSPTGQSRPSGKSWRIPVAVALAPIVPVLAVLIYQDLGEGERGLAAGTSAGAPAMASSAGGMMGTQAEIEAAVERLSQRLEQDPENPQGWAMLGRSLMVLDQPRAAAGAYAQAIRYGGDRDPDILVAYADLVGAIDGGDLSLRAKRFIDRALEVAPDHANALWLGGLAAFHDRDFDTTVMHWNRLARLFPPGSDEDRLIRSNLDEVEAIRAAEAVSETESETESAARVGPRAEPGTPDAEAETP
jgi:cytochrome c-type biogenesis protein CcmH